jgi:hypothetical protein
MKAGMIPVGMKIKNKKCHSRENGNPIVLSCGAEPPEVITI